MPTPKYQTEGAGSFKVSQIRSRSFAPEQNRLAALQAALTRLAHPAALLLESSENKLAFLLKTVEALLIAIAVCFSTGATNASLRFNDLGHRIMCTCSCAQLLGECNHVGCPSSGQMRDELIAAIASGATDEQVLTSFAAKYGATVLAAPTTHGFDLVAWIAPFAVFAAALLGTILLVRHWSVGRTPVGAAEVVDPGMKALREKIRRETEASEL
jgi:cytochrome c-type biogenesis protein CcmH/NrfF